MVWQIILQTAFLFIAFFSACAVFFVLLGIFFPRYKDQPVVDCDMWVDFCYGFFNRLFAVVVITSLTSWIGEHVLKSWLPERRPAALLESLPFAAQVVIALFLYDFFQYWRHRFSHRFLWKFHASHHSAQTLRWSTHFRLHPAELLVDNTLFAVYLYLLGFSLTDSYWVGGVMVLNNMYLHMNVCLRYPFPLNYLLSSPDFHKWHHATEEGAQDKNFSDMFIFLDRLFGTYYFPKDKAFPKEYGVAGIPKRAQYYRSYLKQLVYPFQREKS